jgi:hypothetical protein
VQLAFQVHADHIGCQHEYRLAEHACLGFNAADTPADHADAVDHRGVAVGADQRIRVIHIALRFVHTARQIFEVHLVHDADPGRHDLERVKCLHAPLHELVAFLVALEFQFHVLGQCVLVAVIVDLNRVVDHQVHRHQRLDQFRVFAHVVRHAAHRGQIGEQRYTGEILQHDARHHERDLLGARCVRFPVRQLANMLFGYFLAVAIAQHCFQHNADRDR